MYKVMFLFPSIENQKTQEAPSSCPYCGHSRFTRHGTLSRQMRGGKTISFKRYRCNGCGRTFRVHPEGVSRSRISPHITAVVTFLWATGISGKSVEQASKELGVPVSNATAWRLGSAVGLRHPRGRVAHNPLIILKNGHIPENLEATNPEKTVLLGVLVDAEDGKIGVVALFDQEVDLTRVEKLAEEGGCQLTVETLPWSMRQFLALKSRRKSNAV